MPSLILDGLITHLTGTLKFLTRNYYVPYVPMWFKIKTITVMTKKYLNDLKDQYFLIKNFVEN